MEPSAVIDSGITLTVMSVPVFDLVFNEFDVSSPESTLGQSVSRTRPGCAVLRPVLGGQERFIVVGLEGARLDLVIQGRGPDEATSGELLHITGPPVSYVPDNYQQRVRGPSIIWGSFQQQNLCWEYDVPNERLGINCKSR